MHPVILQSLSMNNSYGITTKFQVTIPKQIRDELGIKESDRLSFERRGEEIIIKKVPTIWEVAEAMSAKFKASGLKPATNEDINNARDEFYKQGMKW